MPSDCNGVSCFQQIFEKKLRIYLWSLGIFTFPWVLAPSWLHFGCRFLCQSSLVELYYRLIYLNQDSSHTGGKITKTLKNNGNFNSFCWFRLNQIQNCSIQIKKMKDEIFSFQLKKITSAKRLKTMPDLKMYPLPLIWLES